MVVRGRVRNGVVVLDEGALLPEEQVVTVIADIQEQAGQAGKRAMHSVLDITPISLGPILRPLQADDDLLGEMLET